MTTLSPLFLEQELCLMSTPFGWGYTRNIEHGDAFLDIEVEIEADTLDRWEIAEIRTIKASSTHEKPQHEALCGIVFATLRRFLMADFADELQCHVDKELLPASLADHADRIYDERNS